MNLSRLIPLAAVLDIKRLRDEGLSWAKLAEAAAELHPDVFAGLSQTQGMAKCRCAYKRKYTTAAAQKPAVKAKTSQPPAKAVKPAKAAKEEPGPDVQLQTLLKSGTAMEDIAAQMGITLRVAQAMVADLKDSGYNVLESGGQYKLSKISPPTINKVVENWSGEKIIRFGLISDTHINCKWTQLSFLHELCARFAREGIPIVYHAGDLDDGEKMHPGHEYEIYSHGADAHIAEIIRVDPRHDGLITNFITGNHDSSYIKQIGMNIGIPIAAARPDMIYLGIDSALVQLTARCTLELSHPGDGSAYAISYKTQKRIDAMSGGEKPNLLAVGHYHKSEILPMYRNVHAIQAGTVCAQTPWMRGKGLAAHVGGWIIEIHVQDDGSIKELVPRFFPCYKTITDDYRNFR